MGFSIDPDKVKDKEKEAEKIDTSFRHMTHSDSIMKYYFVDCSCQKHKQVGNIPKLHNI